MLEEFVKWYKEHSGWYDEVTGLCGAEYHLAQSAWIAAVDEVMKVHNEVKQMNDAQTNSSSRLGQP